jgi:hypothetical protein
MFCALAAEHQPKGPWDLIMLVTLIVLFVWLVSL